MHDENLSPATVAIHCSLDVFGDYDPVAPPIVLSSVYERPEPGEPAGNGVVYSRFQNPNRQCLEGALAHLEGGHKAFAFASGVAAINTMFHALPLNSRVLFPRNVYMGARLAIRAMWQDRLVIDEIEMEDPAVVERELAASPVSLVWIETPSNPLVTITDIAAVAAAAHRHGAIVCVDNTLPTVLLQRPFELGADVVMYSTSKYIGGHSDLIGGALVVREAGPLAERIGLLQWNGGAVPSPFDCWLARRGLMTLGVRVRQHAANAQAVAEHLASHPAVHTVHYPGLPMHPGHALARRQMRGGFGSVVSFQLRGGEAAAARLPHLMHLARNTTSLGGVESLIEQRRIAEGATSPIPGDLIRFSVGIEEIGDLLRDLDQALARA